MGDLALEVRTRLEPAAGVDDLKGDATPLDLDCLTVASHAAVFFDDSQTLAGETVHQ